VVRRFFTALLLLLAWRAHAANQLTIDQRTLRMNDMATVTVQLEGDFAEAEAISPPVRNLAFVGEPWVSTEFAWINGVVSRRKLFRFRVRPLAPGQAQVGPLLIFADDGARQILAPVHIEVLADRTFGSNDAEALLREMSASARDPVFIISEIDKSAVYVGEPVRITWYLYNGVDVQQWQIVGVPKLENFWTEELPVRNEPAERVFVGGGVMQRVPIRRVVLYPLRSGTLSIGGMTVEAAVMRRVRTGFFSGFEGDLVETSFTSAPITVTANPLPAGPPVDAVGDLRLTCEQPAQRNAGPVVVTVMLAGEGNLRGVPAPRFDERVAGDVQIEGGEVTTSREEGSVAMGRRWRYLIFPEREGLLVIPPLTLRAFVPATAERKTLRCEAATLEARAMDMPVSEQRAAARRARRRFWPWVGGGGLALLALALAVPRARRELALRNDVREIVEGKSASEIRAAIEARVNPRLIHEASDRGDAYRALRSMLDAAERERDIAVDAEEEIARRVRELLRIAR
jgi:hypothetical protein